MTRVLCLLAVVVALCFGGRAFAAIAFDAAATGNTCLAATSCTISITPSATANRGLVVGVMVGSASDTVTGVTYNGTAMTQVAKISGDNVTVGYTYLYYLIAPISGAHNIVASASGAANILLTASSYTGVAQTSIPEASATHHSASGTTLTGTVTTITVNDWTVAYGGNFNTGTTAGTNSTFRSNDGFSSSGLTFLSDNNSAIGSPGSFSMTYTLSPGAEANIIIAALQPPTSAVAPGVLTLSSVSKTQAVMALSAQSGGTGPYTCQWYRSTTGGFTPGGGNIIGGATSCSTLTDTPGSVGPWFYVVVVTDSVSGTGTSNQLGAALNGGTNFSICGIGDSIFSGYQNNGGSPTTLGTDPVTFAGIMLAGMTKTRSAIPVSNSAYAGTKTTDWLPSGATTGCGGSACLAPALAACAALTPAATIIVGQLGANDAVAGTTAATIYANIQTITAYLVTQGYTKVIWFQSAYGYPGGGSGVFTNATTGIQSALNALLPGLDNGTTILWAGGNGGNLWPWSINNYLSGTLYNGDNLHPTALGDQVLAANIACAISNAVDANSCNLTGGGGTGGGHIIGGWNHLQPLDRRDFDRLAHLAANNNFPIRLAR